MSLRARLIVGIVFVAVVLVGAAALVTRTTESDLLTRIDDQLTSLPTNGDGAGGGPAGPGPRGHDDRPYTNLNYYKGIVATDGSVTTAQTPSGANATVALPRISPDAALAALADRKPFTVDSNGSSGTRYRVLAVGNPNDRVLVALPLNDVDATVSRLVNLEVLATVLILAILGVVAFWVLRLGVRPVKQMTATATAIAAGDLSHRVPDVNPSTEAGELGAALNTMLGRIQDAFEQRAASEGRLRRFVGDASHELRTPVTTIRGYAELYRSGGLADPEELSQAMRRTEQEAIRMGSLIEDMLLLARLDQGRPLERTPVPLGQLASDAARDAMAVAPDRDVDADVDDGVVVIGDEGRLRQVVANLVANALVHTPSGTPLHLAVRRDDGQAVLEVRDEGPGMPPDVADHAFERFYRADASRSRHQGGSGLGLSIVLAIVEAHGGRVAIKTAPGAGTAVRVELPI
jgi:two-component system OmpR family sensor kinase